MLSTIIVDDFFPNPDNVRQYALSLQDWHKDEGFNWPGIRTKNLHTFAEEYHNALAWSVYNCMPNHIISKYDAFSKFHAMFHIAGEEYIGGLIHDDGNDLDFAGLVYLNPEPLENSGTSLYHHVTNQLEYFTEEIRPIKKNFFSNPENNQFKEQFIDFMNKRSAQFAKVTTVENVYNRCVIYDSHSWHGANKYFGNTRENSRLTLVFFGKFGNGQDNIK